MSPRELDRDVMTARLQLIEELLSNLKSLGEISADSLSTDWIRRSAVERVLMQLVDAAVAINSHVASAMLGRTPATYRQSYELAAEAGAITRELAQLLQPSVGLRNVLSHEYAETDLELAAKGADLAVSQYGQYACAVAAWLANTAPKAE
jgi:uncharacterized protein YutE (UPF0331/DUF86 family)